MSAAGVCEHSYAANGEFVLRFGGGEVDLRAFLQGHSHM